jgi:hypothetical protein
MVCLRNISVDTLHKGDSEDDDDDDDDNNNNNNKDLTIEIQRMLNVKIKVIPVIIAATETVTKSFRRYVSNIPGNHEV